MRSHEESLPISMLGKRTRRTRRDFLLSSAKVAAGGTLATLFAGRGMAAFAQGTPNALDLNYPEVKVTFTDQTLQTSTQSVPAGYVLLTVTNNSKDQSSAGVLGPGAGQTVAQMMQAAATPPASPQGMPPFLYTADVRGGPGDINPGETSQAIIKLDEGDWFVFAEGNQPPATLKATAASGTQQAPAAAFTVTEVDFAFGGWGKTVPAGKQIWEVVNKGTQPHMLVLLRVPAGTTIEQILQIASLPDNATPPPGGLQQSQVTDAGGVLLQSPGTTVWPILDLAAGHYAAACFVADPRNGEPHVMEGMISLFDVK